MANLEVNNDASTFEMSFRILGNEFLGFKITVDDFKTKWLIISILGLFALAAVVRTFSSMGIDPTRFIG